MDTYHDTTARSASEADGGKMSNETGKDRVRMSVADARALGEAAMHRAGDDEDEARILTDHMLDSALCGHAYFGLPKLLNVVVHPDFRLPRRPVTVVRERGLTALRDGVQAGSVSASR